VSGRTYTADEAKALAVDAALRALREYAATHPVPATMTVQQAAEALSVSPRTIHRMKPQRMGARIPYTWVVSQLERKS
jgi:hypothetical protein